MLVAVTGIDVFGIFKISAAIGLVSGQGVLAFVLLLMLINA
jgi:hypothetical protein